MERKMSKKLLEWKNDKDKMPLIIYGARQVGKTYTILTFGKEHYKNVAYINFVVVSNCKSYMLISFINFC